MAHLITLLLSLIVVIPPVLIISACMRSAQISQMYGSWEEIPKIL